jgi:hypothetical protein
MQFSRFKGVPHTVHGKLRLQFSRFKGVPHTAHGKSFLQFSKVRGDSFFFFKKTPKIMANPIAKTTINAIFPLSILLKMDIYFFT